LYNFLGALPLELTTHNIGSVDSIANVLFLAGKIRLAAPNTRFLFHNCTWIHGGPATLERDQMKEHTQSLDADAEQFAELFRLHTALTDKDFEALQLLLQRLKQSHFIRPTKAKEMGIIHDIQDASIAFGNPVLNIDF
jgi:ATP-dependent protease ClpP protease subunit